jgi:hypothetical protein
MKLAMKNTKSSHALSPLSRLSVLAVSLVSLTTLTRNAEGRPLRSAVSGYEVQVLVDGSPAPTFWHNGETYIMGRTGERYVIRVHNRTGRRIEAVVSVDGRDVVDGKNGDFRNQRGYLVPAWGSVDVDGWRLSQSQAAAFRFSSVADSYAARMGNAREVGVIGIAVFAERVYYPPPRPVSPPCCIDYDREDLSYGDVGKRSRQESAPAPAASDYLAEGHANKAKGARASSGYAPSRRPGLGTEFGEAVNSSIQEVEFVRANAATPSVILGVRYNDRDGLVAMGVNVDGVYPWPSDSELRRTADPFPASPRRYATPPAGWRRY